MLSLMFIANEKHKFIFVDIPLSIQQIPETINDYVLDCCPVNSYKKHKNILPFFCYSVDIKNKIGPTEWKKLYTFGVIRNPFDRMVDMFDFFATGPVDRIAWCRGIKNTKAAIREQHRLQSRGFVKWLTDDKDYEYLHTTPFCGHRLTPQVNWLSEVKEIFSFEHTSPLLNKVFKLTQTTLPSYRGVMTKRERLEKRASYFKSSQPAIDLVADSFKEDIKMFKYTIDS